MYLHGYAETEQQRHTSQAHMLQPWVFDGVDLAGCSTLLEPGCGVGAQTVLLLEKYPQLQITAVDASARQLEAARRNVPDARVQFIQADAAALPLVSNSFDSVFTTFFFEHVVNPTVVLQELHRVMRPGAPLHGVEVFNQSLFIHPPGPALQHYWDAFNAIQREAGGNPNVGVFMATLLHDVGYINIETEPLFHLLDVRDVEFRSTFVRYWCNLLANAAPTLIRQRRLSASEARQAFDELLRAEIFTYCGVRFRAVK